MYLIVGLGNPEPEYSLTRHNMGFDTINVLSKKFDIPIDKKGFEGIYGVGTIGEEKVILLKPQTYMNESGKSIIQAKNFYKIENEKLIVIYDDIDLEEGTVKLRKKGGAGTHNGMKSVIGELGSVTFPHVRIGTGMPVFKSMLISYVIEKISEEKHKELEPAIERAAEATVEIVKSGIDIAMNKYN